MSSRAEATGFGRRNEAGALATAFGWVATGLVVQAALVPFVAIAGGMPSAVGIGVVLFALRRPPLVAAIFGLLTGALADALSGGTGAAWIFATTAEALALGLLARLVFIDGIVLCSLAVFAGVLVRDVLFWTGMKVAGYPSGLGLDHLHMAMISAAESAAVTVVLLFVRARWAER